MNKFLIILAILSFMYSCQKGDLKSLGKIVFVSNKKGNLDIFSINPDGSGLKALTNHPADDTYPLVAPTGDMISFLSKRTGNWELHTLNLNTSKISRLTYTKKADEHSPSWSPLEKIIAFSTDRDDGNWEIYMMNHKGEGLVNLTNSKFHEYSPCWSPDGKKLAFISERSGKAQIYTMNKDGSNVKQLTFGGERKSIHASAWSPDGKNILYLSVVNESSEVFILDTMTGKSKQLTVNNARLWKVVDGKKVRQYPHSSASWSPDGKFIIYIKEHNGTSQIFTMNKDGKNRKHLSTFKEKTFSPDWGKFISNI